MVWDLIEIRLQRVDAYEAWEDIEPIVVRVESTLQANRIARALLVDPVWEARWNVKGSLQGHYVNNIYSHFEEQED